MFSIFSMFSVFSQLPLHVLPSRMAGWNNLWSPGWVYSKICYSVNSQVCCSFGNVSSQNPLPTHSLKAHIGWILKNQVQRQRVRQTIWQTHYMPYIFNPVDSSASSMIIVDVEYITLVNWATSINPSKKRAKSLFECVIVFFYFVRKFTSFLRMICSQNCCWKICETFHILVQLPESILQRTLKVDRPGPFQ